MKNIIISGILLSISTLAAAETKITCEKSPYTFEINIDDVETDTGTESSYTIFKDEVEIESGTYKASRQGYVALYSAYVYNVSSGARRDKGLSVGTSFFGGNGTLPTVGTFAAQGKGKFGEMRLRITRRNTTCTIEVTAETDSTTDVE